MWLFGSKKANCCMCGALSKVDCMRPDAVKMSDGNYLCGDCMIKYGIGSLQILATQVNKNVVENRKKSADFVNQGNFKATKTIFRPRNGIVTDIVLMQIDENSGLVNLPSYIERGFSAAVPAPVILPMSKILDFELLENGNVVTEGNSLLGAAAGGLLFGGVGAIVGAGVASKDSNQVLRTMTIKVTVDDFNEPAVYLDLLGLHMDGVKKGSCIYNAAFNAGQECMSLLTLIIKNNRQNNETLQKNVASGSVADEILKFKQLLDMGAITEEEFNAKKKELLGL